MVYQVTNTSRIQADMAWPTIENYHEIIPMYGNMWNLLPMLYPNIQGHLAKCAQTIPVCPATFLPRNLKNYPQVGKCPSKTYPVINHSVGQANCSAPFPMFQSNPNMKRRTAALWQFNLTILLCNTIYNYWTLPLRSWIYRWKNRELSLVMKNYKRPPRFSDQTQGTILALGAADSPHHTALQNPLKYPMPSMDGRWVYRIIYMYSYTSKDFFSEMYSQNRSKSVSPSKIIGIHTFF